MPNPTPSLLRTQTSHEDLCTREGVDNAKKAAGTTDFTPHEQIFFSLLKEKGKEGGGGKTEKYATKVAAPKAPHPDIVLY